MGHLDFETYSGGKGPPVNLHTRDGWLRGRIESWQRLGGVWWATVTYLTPNGRETRTSLPVTKIRPSDG